MLSPLAPVEEFIGRHSKLLIITGAGCSTGSGIPAYRNQQGQWMARTPIQHQEFVGSENTRRRYWARSVLGWRNMQQAEPNDLHRSVVRWEQSGRLELLITQNVDGLHRRAGSRNIVELHGRIDQVVCLGCAATQSRLDFQTRLVAANRELVARLQALDYQVKPDGDAEFGDLDYTSLVCPPCLACGGVVMPDVVFFGGNVPKARVNACYEAVARADGLLILGSSMMVYSGFRFAKRAAELGKPIAIINQGVTRADELASLKVETECVSAVSQLDRVITGLHCSRPDAVSAS